MTHLQSVRHEESTMTL